MSKPRLYTVRVRHHERYGHGERAEGNVYTVATTQKQATDCFAVFGQRRLDWKPAGDTAIDPATLTPGVAYTLGTDGTPVPYILTNVTGNPALDAEIADAATWAASVGFIETGAPSRDWGGRAARHFRRSDTALFIGTGLKPGHISVGVSHGARSVAAHELTGGIVEAAQRVVADMDGYVARHANA